MEFPCVFILIFFRGKDFRKSKFNDLQHRHNGGTMELKKDGITIVVNSEFDADRLKQAGYTEAAKDVKPKAAVKTGSKTEAERTLNEHS